MGMNMMGAGPWAKKAYPVSLASGQEYVLPSGQYFVRLGHLVVVQFYDALTGIWRTFANSAQSGFVPVTADGANVRLFNPSGTVVGAYVTNGGSGYTNGIYPYGTIASGSYVLATASAGLGNFSVIVGGAINTSVTLTTAGAGYNYPPTLVFSDPPAGGVKASAVATVSGGAITGVTVVNQGAGYTAAPTITVVPDPRDTITTAAALTVNSTLANSGRVTAVLLGTSGGAGYAGTPPTISFSASAGTSAAATAVMCYTVTAAGTVTGGAQLDGATVFFQSAPLATAKTNAPVNPSVEQGLFLPRLGYGAVTLAAGAASAITVVDGGLHQSSTIVAPFAVTWSGGALGNTGPTAGTLVVGGSTGTADVLTL